MVILEATPPSTEKGNWKVEYRFASDQSQVRTADATRGADGLMTFEIPIEQPVPPGIKARLRVETRFWNKD